MATPGSRPHSPLAAAPDEDDVRLSNLFEPAPAVLLSHEVVDRLRDSIITGRLATGYRLREEQLADAFNVSRGPVRNALEQLEREGLVVRRPNRGAVVAELSRGDLEEVYSLRLAIEPVACAWAARNADDQDLAAMQAVIRGYAKLNSRVTAQQAAEADLGFHDVVYRSARHKRLFSLWQTLRPQVYVFLLARRYVRDRGFRDVMIENHGAILGAISRGDEDGARAIAAEHVSASYGKVLAAYDGG
jgi:DNA-binding GntR family transcriptional regulator